MRNWLRKQKAEFAKEWKEVPFQLFAAIVLLLLSLALLILIVMAVV